jgi:hypothetical protein
MGEQKHENALSRRGYFKIGAETIGIGHCSITALQLSENMSSHLARCDRANTRVAAAIGWPAGPYWNR